MLFWLAAHPGISRLLVALVALWVAWVINWAIYTQAYYRRAIGPWNPPPTGAAARSWADWIPVLGWWRLRREAAFHDGRFWLRPLLIEIAFPLAMVWLYDAETTGKLLPFAPMAAGREAELHCQFIAHFVLIALMTAATFIDFDEQLIPDTITVPGTLFGLLGSATFASWFPLLPASRSIVEMDAASYAAWPKELNGPWGLGLALAIATAWCFGLLDRTWITRRGWKRAPVYLIATIFRTRWWMIVAAVWLTLLAAIVVAWQTPIARWQFLLSALCGLACSGGITWAVRIASRMALRVEALGFGDVTLMAMIGTYIGWQPSLLVFFVAPLVAVLIFAARSLILGSGHGPYGPYLCIATVVVLVFWDSFLQTYAAPILELPPWVTFAILGLAVVMLGAMLWIWRLIGGPIHRLRNG